MSNYGAKDIQILKGLEPVRRRPGMYIGDTGVRGYHHLLREVIDNAVDEFLDGHVSSVKVEIDTDTQRVAVTDDGRGIPVSKHPKAGISTLTAVLTRLHAGGKFGAGAYASSVAGLHGIGVKATNALSTELQVWTRRKGKTWTQRFECGSPTSDVQIARGSLLKRGTRVSFIPDSSVFGKAKWHPKTIASWLRDTAYLCPGLSLQLTIDGGSVEYHYDGGLLSMLEAVTEDEGLLSDPIVISADDYEAALVWTDLEGEQWRSYVNVVRTPSHGVHVQGLKRALSDVLNDGSDSTKYRWEDLREGLVGVVHVRVAEPLFKGQTKTRLENPEVEDIAYDTAYQQLQRYFAENTAVAKKLRDRASRMAKAREKFRAEQKAIKGTKVKKNARGILPGKLIEAPNCNPDERELFIVEGLSAEGTVTAARVTKKGKKGKYHYQEVYPLRGKLRNAMQGDLAKITKNPTIKDLFVAIGTGVGDAFDLRRCRYNSIYLLVDADPDGKHIAALILSLFVRHVPELLRTDMIRVVQNPLFMGVSAKERMYANSVEEIKKALGKKAVIRRFKGLGESNATEISEYAMNPQTRKTLRVLWDENKDEEFVLKYMGSNTEARKELLGVD
jgi:DNA gyrase subunit B